MTRGRAVALVFGSGSEGHEFDSRLEQCISVTLPQFRSSNAGFCVNFFVVVCDESGHTKFPFSYLARVTLLTLFRLGSVPAQDLLRLAHFVSPLLTLITIFLGPRLEIDKR
jgi:hypothetical protein